MKNFWNNFFFGSLLFFVNTFAVDQIPACAACKPSVASASLAKEKKPNILLILTDDQGYEDVSFAGTKDLNTPAIDALREEGMRFTYFYTNCIYPILFANLPQHKTLWKSGYLYI